MSLPWNTIWPASGAWMPAIVLPSVVFPQPDSPTTPSVSPGCTAKLTSSSALIAPVAKPKAFLSLKWRRKSATERIGSGALIAVPPRPAQRDGDT